MKIWHSFSLVALMSACSIQDGKAPIYPDYCKPSQKTFSNIEKIHAAIEYILDNKNAVFNKGSERIMHLMRYYGEHSNENPREIAARYYGAFPECCRIIRPPSYVKWYEAMSGVGISDQEIIGKPGEWVADVLVVDLARNEESRRLQQSQFRVSGCNQISLINRG